MSPHELGVMKSVFGISLDPLLIQIVERKPPGAAEQVEHGAPRIRTHVRSPAPHAADLGNIASPLGPRAEPV
jgi:hypothetical protein